jgi:uncharacterized protein involved in exopolysaccharide biosynthesis
VHAADATIAKIKDAIGTLIKNDEAEATRSLVNINQLIQNFEDQLKTVPSELLGVIALTRSNDVFGQLFVLLMQKEEEADVSTAGTIVDTRVATPAEFPMTATTPKAALTVLTELFLGLSAGIGLVLAQPRYPAGSRARRRCAAATPCRYIR